MDLRFFLLLVVATGTLDLAGCDNAPTSTAVMPAPNLHVLSVRDPNNATVELQASDHTKIFGVASWCPHTKSFIRVLNDPIVKEELKPYEFIFVLQADEWPDVQKNLEDEAVNGKVEGMPIAKAMGILKKRAGNAPIFDPEFVDGLPGRYYFLPAVTEVASGFQTRV
jgi:hypothetical protein